MTSDPFCRVLVCGGRNFSDREHLESYLGQVLAQVPAGRGMFVIHGGARGADRMAEAWAKSKGIHCARVDALWDIHGKGAGPVRNAAMLALQPELVVAFPGGRGTENMVMLARENKIPVVKA